MASQKPTNCCVAAIALAASTYVSTPHCSTIARLAFGVFCLAIHLDAFLGKHQDKVQDYNGSKPFEQGHFNPDHLTLENNEAN
ncbi:MAG: hypothetical protein R6V08_11385 [Desulfuromonadales bacterium]